MASAQGQVAAILKRRRRPATLTTRRLTAEAPLGRNQAKEHGHPHAGDDEGGHHRGVGHSGTGGPPAGPSGPTPAACAAGSTWPPPACTDHRDCSWTSRPPVSTRAAEATYGPLIGEPPRAAEAVVIEDSRNGCSRQGTTQRSCCPWPAQRHSGPRYGLRELRGHDQEPGGGIIAAADGRLRPPGRGLSLCAHPIGLSVCLPFTPPLHESGTAQEHRPDADQEPADLTQCRQKAA